MKNQIILTIVAASLLAGCTPRSLLEPTFPAVPPEQPAKSAAEKPKRELRQDGRGPLSPKDINDRNARQALRDLEAELDQAGESAVRE